LVLPVVDGVDQPIVRGAPNDVEMLPPVEGRRVKRLFELKRIPMRLTQIKTWEAFLLEIDIVAPLQL
jgi:hypothetical protein